MSENQISKTLLDRFQAGDELAAAEIWNRYASRLNALARQRIRPGLSAKIDAEDILQTTFAEFFEKAKKDAIYWQRQGDLWRLLVSIAIHHVGRQIEKYSTAKRSLVRESSATEVDQLSHRDQHVAQRMQQLIEPLLCQHDSVLTAVVRGRLAGQTLGEISAQTGRSQRTLRRVLQKIKAILMADSEFNIQLPRSPASPPNEVLSARYADFDLLKMVGAGGFGKVYLARDRIRDTFVAVKALRRDWIGNRAAEHLFLNEAQTIAGLDHPNIVRFHQAGPLPNGSWFMVLDYVAGQRLDRIDLKTIPAATLLDWIQQMVAAMVYLHRQGVIHGDLKPANLLTDAQRVWLVDFGFCRQSDPHNKPVNWIGGTRGFTAPELKTSTAADVFAMGRVIEYLMGEAGRSCPQLSALVAAATVRDPARRITSKELSDRLPASCCG